MVVNRSGSLLEQKKLQWAKERGGFHGFIDGFISIEVPIVKRSDKIVCTVYRGSIPPILSLLCISNE